MTEFAAADAERRHREREPARSAQHRVHGTGVAGILSLQSLAGNHAVSQLLRPRPGAGNSVAGTSIGGTQSAAELASDEYFKTDSQLGEPPNNQCLPGEPSASSASVRDDHARPASEETDPSSAGTAATTAQKSEAGTGLVGNAPVARLIALQQRDRPGVASKRPVDRRPPNAAPALRAQPVAGLPTLARVPATAEPAVAGGPPGPAATAERLDPALEALVTRLRPVVASDPDDRSGRLRRAVASLDPSARRAVLTRLMPLMSPSLAAVVSGASANAASGGDTVMRPAGAAPPPPPSSGPDQPRGSGSPTPSAQRDGSGSAAAAGRPTARAAPLVERAPGIPGRGGPDARTGAERSAPTGRQGQAVNGHGGATAGPIAAADASAFSADGLTRVTQPDPPVDRGADPWTGLVTESPRLEQALGPLRASVAAARSRVSAAAQQSRQSVGLAAGQARQDVEATVAALTAQLAAMGETAHAQLRAGAIEQQAAVSAAVSQEQQAVRAAVAAEADRFTTTTADQSGNVRSLAERQHQDAMALGTSSADRARSQSEGQAQAAEGQGRAVASSYHDDDPDRAAAMGGAARQVAAAQAEDIRHAAPDLAHGAQEQAGRAATTSTDPAQQAAESINRSASPGRAAILDLGAGVADQMRDGSKAAHDGLGSMTGDLGGGLTDLFTTLYDRVRELHRMQIDQVSVVERAVLDQVDTVETQAQQRVDAVAIETAVRLAGRRGRVRAGEPDGAAAVADGASTALAGLGGAATDQLGAITAEGRTAAAGIEQHAGESGQAVVAGQRTSGESVVAQLGQTLTQTTTTATAGAATTANELRTGNQQLADQATGQMSSGYTQAAQQVTSTVDGGLQQNTTAVNQLGAHIGQAADQAAEEYDRPWWKKALYAVGKAALYLAAAIIATLILAVVIWVAAAVLAAAGIIAGISFATAFAIAVVVGAAAFFLYECYTRAKAYRAEHGPTHGFWQTLGVTLGIVTASAFSVIGLTQIIEGARGKRFFSDREMTSQERYDSVIGGVFALVLTLFGGRLFGRGGPRTEPGGGPVLDPAGSPVLDPGGGGGPRPADPIPAPDPNAPRPADPAIDPADPNANPPEPVPAGRALGLRDAAAQAIRRLENIKDDPVGDVNSQPRHNHYAAARREAAGEVVARRPDGRPYSHIGDLQRACDGLFNVRETLLREEANPPDTMTERGMNVLLERLAQVNRMINRLAGFLNEIGHGQFPPYHEWPPGS